MRSDRDGRYLMGTEAAGDHGRESGQSETDGRDGSRVHSETAGTAPAWAALILTFSAVVFFIAVIGASKIFPSGYLLVLCAALFLIFIVIAVLLFGGGRRRRFWIGMGIAVPLTAVLSIGGCMCIRGAGALEDITTPDTAVPRIGVFVQQSDQAQSLSEMAGYTYGIMGNIDRDNVDDAVKQLEGRLGQTLQTVEFKGPMSLVDGLMDNSVQAIVMDAAFLSGVSGMEGYEDIFSRVREVERIGVKAEQPAPAAAAPEKHADAGADAQPFSVYITGIDSRNGLTARSLSDVNIIAAINPAAHQVLLVSTPRDYFVPLSVSNGQRDKLTHAGWYGVDVCMDTMELLYDMDIDYYFRVCFEGFRDIVDAVGGVTVYSEIGFQATHIDRYFAAGDNDMNGDEALAYARERYAFPDGDRQRGRNQMKLIKALAGRLLSPDLLVKYPSILAALQDNFETTIPYELIAKQVNRQLAAGSGWEIITYSVNGSDDYQVTYSLETAAYVMQPDYETVETAKTMMRRVMSGERIEAP